MAKRPSSKPFSPTPRPWKFTTRFPTPFEEHKWYLSERRKREVPFTEAAQDWLQKVFIPVCELIKKEGVLDFFPDKTASELYVKIMNNKYVLSKEKGKDVGIIHATRDYAKKFGQEPPLAAFWNGIARKVREILRMQSWKFLFAAVFWGKFF